MDIIDSALKKYNFKIYTMGNINIKGEYVAFVKHNHVKAMNIGKSILTGLKSIVGGQLSYFDKLLKDAREIVIVELIEEAYKAGANAIIGLEMDLTMQQNFIAVFGYGTAIKTKK